MATTPFNGQVNVNQGTKFLPADTTVAKQISNNGNVPSVVKAILITSTDTVARVVDLFYTVSGVNYLVGSATIPANQGQAGTLSVDLLDGTHILAGSGWNLAGAALSLGMESTITAAKEIDVVVISVQ